MSGEAFRPLDVYPSRKGITVEIGNTDAEGRLVLADALALADEETPDLLIDMGTLTGAARVALGPELPPYYTDDETLAADIATYAGIRERSAVAHAALAALRRDARFQNRRREQRLGRRLCRLDHLRAVPQALREQSKSLAHFDIYAWTPAAKPARPEGGECQAARALYALLKARYG